jgi:hypothetical protein
MSSLAWLLFLLVGAILIAWRKPLLGYLEGRPYLSDDLRRYINRELNARHTILVTDSPERDKNWVYDLCGVTAINPEDFAKTLSVPECVVSIANERRLTLNERAELFEKLSLVPFVLRIRTRMSASTEDMKTADDAGERRLVAGNWVFRYNAQKLV